MTGSGLGMAALFAACGDSSETRLPRPDPPTISLAEEWRIDGNSAPLGPIGWLVISPGNTLYVSQPLDRRVIAFDEFGERVGAFGRRGTAPGQFANMGRAGMLGDTLWVYDAVQRRITYISPGLQLERIARWPPRVLASGVPPGSEGIEVSGPHLYAMTADGRVLASVYRRPRASRGVRVDSTLTRPDWWGQTVRRLAAHVVPRDVALASGTNVVFNTRPFPIDPIFAARSDGRSFAYLTVAVEGADAGTFTVTQFDAAGDTLFSRRHPYYPVPIPGEVVEAAIERAEQRLARREAATPRIIAAFRDSVKIPPVYPPIESVVIGGDGSTWIRMRPLVAANSEYYVLGPTGNMVGQVSLPGKVWIAAADLTAAWGIETDARGVESVVKYRVARPGLSQPAS